MFAGDRPAPGQYLAEKLVQTSFSTPLGVRFGEVHHHIDVNISVARMTEAGDGEEVFLLELCCEPKNLLEPSPRHHDVLIQFGQTRIAQGVREFAAKTPDFFTGFYAQGHFDEKRFE